jgi:hypothetical protein
VDGDVAVERIDLHKGRAPARLLGGDQRPPRAAEEVQDVLALAAGVLRGARPVRHAEVCRAGGFGVDSPPCANRPFTAPSAAVPAALARRSATCGSTARPAAAPWVGPARRPTSGPETPSSATRSPARAFEKGYWQSEGKTPHATVYSAIVREIQKKGDDARFRKTARGKFQLAK